MPDTKDPPAPAQTAPESFWYEISFKLPHDTVELAEQILNSLNALSITLKDAQDQPLLEPMPGEHPLWDQAVLTAMFSQHEDPQHILLQLKTALEKTASTDFSIGILKNREWKRVCLDSLKPLQFGNKLWIYPSHIKPPQDTSTVITLDPGLAFGTGTHPTTAMCLQWLDNHPPIQQQVIDYGCGSGILAIAAAKLGAAHVHAVDIDSQALTASRQNAANNDVSRQLSVSTTGLLPPLQADLLVANILSNILIDLSDTISALLKPGGKLVLSGILQTQARQVSEAYPLFVFKSPVQQEDWVLLEGCKESAES